MTPRKPLGSLPAPISETDYAAWLRRLRMLRERLPQGNPLSRRATYEEISRRANAIWVSGGCLPETHEQKWRQAELELQRESGSAPWRQVVSDIEADLNRTEVTVAFGGNQKAGKSTLLNGAMRRPLLAVDELPETGTICRITLGEKDRARVIRDRTGRKTEVIPCTTEALRQVTALQPGASRKRRDELAECVELTLRGVPIPAGVWWLDSPGVDDTAEMTERAREAAAAADVLIFVASSRQFLSDGETTFLAEHVAAHGPASVVLIVNAFLKSMTQEAWAAFYKHLTGPFRNRMAERAADMGFTAEAPLLAYPVAAQALAQGDGSMFGGGQLLKLLQGIRSRAHPRVLRTRLHRASERLRRLGEQIDIFRQTLWAAVEEAERSARASAEAAAHRAQQFGRQASVLVGELVNAVAQQICQAGMSVCESVTDGWSNVTVSATCGYDRALKEKAIAAAEEGMKSFLQRLHDSIVEHEQKLLPSEVQHQIREQLTGTKFNVTGGRDVSTIGQGAELAGAASAAGATWWLHIATGGLSLAVAAGAGAIAAAAAREQAQNEAAAQARLAIRSSIDSETTRAVSEVRSSRDRILKLVLEACTRPPSVPGPLLPQREALRELECLSAEVLALVRVGRRLAGAKEAM